jgi:hypothetical protein
MMIGLPGGSGNGKLALDGKGDPLAGRSGTSGTDSALVTAAGFVERTWLAGPELMSLLEHLAPAAPGTGPSKALLIRQNADATFENTARNMSEGRTTLGLGVYERV